MKRFRGFVIKEFYHIFRDYRTLLILFGMPAVVEYDAAEAVSTVTLPDGTPFCILDRQ